MHNWNLVSNCAQLEPNLHLCITKIQFYSYARRITGTCFTIYVQLNPVFSCAELEPKIYMCTNEPEPNLHLCKTRYQFPAEHSWKPSYFCVQPELSFDLFITGTHFIFVCNRSPLYLLWWQAPGHKALDQLIFNWTRIRATNWMVHVIYISNSQVFFK